MPQCEMWYHAACINMDKADVDAIDEDTEWYCPKCSGLSLHEVSLAVRAGMIVHGKLQGSARAAREALKNTPLPPLRREPQQMPMQQMPMMGNPYPAAAGYPNFPGGMPGMMAGMPPQGFGMYGQQPPQYSGGYMQPQAQQPQAQQAMASSAQQMPQPAAQPQ